MSSLWQVLADAMTNAVERDRRPHGPNPSKTLPAVPLHHLVHPLPNYQPTPKT